MLGTKPAGPPCTTTIIGAFAAGFSGGASSQPCTSNLSLFQRMLRASPAGERNAALRCVSGFHAPIGPATISGGSAKVLRSMAPFKAYDATDRTFGTDAGPGVATG